ncbi:MAG: glycosyltransferase family 4 protein, partial [Saprospiraceae bacterium]
MKILFCADIYETKYVGPARFAEMLLHINEIYKGIHEVRVLTADVAEEQMPVYKMSLRYPKFLRFLDPLSRGWKYYRAIRRIENEYEFDVVLFGNAIGGIVPKFLYRGDIKVVGMINDYISVRVNITNFYKLRGGKGLLLQKQFEKLSTFYLNTIIVCSEYLKELLSQAYYCPKKKIKRLHQGIDIGKTSFKPKAIEGKNIEIIFLKYLFDYGGLSDLAVTLGQLRKYDFNLSV